MQIHQSISKSLGFGVQPCLETKIVCTKPREEPSASNPSGSRCSPCLQCSILNGVQRRAACSILKIINSVV